MASIYNYRLLVFTHGNLPFWNMTSFTIFSDYLKRVEVFSSLIAGFTAVDSIVIELSQMNKNKILCPCLTGKNITFRTAAELKESAGTQLCSGSTSASRGSVTEGYPAESARKQGQLRSWSLIIPQAWRCE